MIKKMLFLIVIYTVAAYSTMANAEQLSSIKEIDDSKCRAVMDMSKQAMNARQAGVELPEMLEVVDKIYGDNNTLTTEAEINTKNIALIMVVRAFNLPIYESMMDKNEAITEFGNQSYLECMNSMLK